MIIDPEVLLRAYAVGLFPMADSREDEEVFWVEPKDRAILPLDGFHLSRSLRKTLRRDVFTIRCNTAFEEVVDLCAEAAPDRRESWINPTIRESYQLLNQIGHAHSIECWQKGVLVGGLYGVSLGRVFCGESMFSRQRDASKVALCALVAAMRHGGFTLLDCQFMTDHLASLGAIDISQEAYLERLDVALQGSAYERPAARRPRLYGTAGGGGSSAGAVSVGAGGVAGAGVAGAGAEPSLPDAFSELISVAGADGRRAGADSDDSDVLDPAMGSSSPGKLIAQSLTQTS
ncbi:MAG: leucyl/phenylalanyl-tRNA--protein transferase [Pseudomonadota bacterium]